MRSSAKKNKGKKKIVKVEEILDRLQKFADEWQTKQSEIIEKHNALNEQVGEIRKIQQQIATFAATEFGKMLAAQETFRQRVNDTVQHLDINTLATAEMLKEVFGQLTQVDHHLKKLLPDEEGKVAPNKELSEDDITAIKAEAEEWYTSVMKSAFASVHERLKKEAEEATAAAQKLKEEQEKAEASKSEDERVEQELQRAQEADRVPQFSGGEGADIPEGADVFGG